MVRPGSDSLHGCTLAARHSHSLQNNVASPRRYYSGSYIHLPTRGLLEIRGKDSTKFLQGLITNHMPRIEEGGSGFLAGFLNPKGRVMYDVFVHPTNFKEDQDPSYLIECDARALPDLHKHIARFVLRNKVKMIGATESYDVYSVFDEKNNPDDNMAALEVHADNSAIKEKLEQMSAPIGLKDNRAGDMMGYRVILPKGQQLTLPNSFQLGTLEDYNVRRIMNGVPEGIDDFIPGTSLPMECNLDYMGGIDFRKGCYVGQELTIRTHHTGTTRKRVMPVQYYRPEEPVPEKMQYQKDASYVVPAQSELFPVKGDEPASAVAPTTSARAARASGRSGSNIGNIGLALVKLEQAQEKNSFEVMDREGSKVRARAFFPPWWPKQE
ncbi:ccr4 associated factor [Lunasporangiospora selenospora]|uniref:Ccr4 associated factor n=1 Tax=Lunasporangiospora selenospora TaxID=979761 RepID=A0A9P6KEV7_9FUNG|nr:ccr4 associated factor [Lunasporangiospora selenospora]